LGKTIFNKLNSGVKSLINSLYESQFNITSSITNDAINKNEIKKAINKIISDLDDNVCINKNYKKSMGCMHSHKSKHEILYLPTYVMFD